MLSAAVTKRIDEPWESNTSRNEDPNSRFPFLVDRLEAARLLCVSPGTIDNLRKRGQLPSLKIQARRLYDVGDLRRFIESRKEVEQ
ncbi:helix-turn-helix domain-containing protein [Nodularia spumigena]|uniref:helix-turn-helix domain-containing protein n=1 Tax=Nodularia spumigena TaxID=70799 RepID=UPI002B1FDBCF|nr:helix-turn-helix domain-containing protein [Nodularia spumigena]MEA5615131.1 helix-turn-helix domain-containing protein [Nodularia spumigena UHCC 0040]